MEKSTNNKHKIDFLLSNDALSSNQTQKTIKIKKKYDVLSSSHQLQKTFKIKKKCSECNKIRTPSDENNQICYTCNKAKKRIIPSGNKVIDDFIKYTQTNCAQRIGRMMFVPYEKFRNIKLIGEGGFSKIYKATWIDSKISEEGILNYYLQNESKTVALKKINNSKNITSNELTELKLFYLYSLNVTKPNIYGFHNYINVYYGITQDPLTQDLIFIMPYYNSDLSHYIIKDFFNINWYHKLNRLKEIINSLNEIHDVDIIHRDLHSGNILIDENILTKKNLAKLCDIGISKSATEHDLSNDNEENNIYGIIPYVAPEVLRGKNYTKASDVYSFGMIMWELMVGRRPFWDRNHNTELIIEICDGLRPPIITNAPKGYIDLMKECWHSDPKKRPKTVEVLKKIDEVLVNEQENKTEIIESSDIGPVTTNNPDAIYKSRYLSGMIKSAASKRNLKSQSITLKLDQFDPNNKRNFDDNQLSSFDNCMEKVLKRIKLNEDENNDLYVTKRN